MGLINIVLLEQNHLQTDLTEQHQNEITEFQTFILT